MKKVAYGKLGRVIETDPAKWGGSGGDNEAPALLLSLATRHPDIEWVVVGKNSGWTPPLPNITNKWQEWKTEIKMPSNTHVYDRVRRLDEVTLSTFEDLDGIVMWLGQHGSSNYPIPMVDKRETLTSPQTSFVAYSSFILRGINMWRKEDPVNREETWLLADVRNYLKARDLKNPRQHPILSQFDFSRREKLERYGADYNIEGARSHFTFNDLQPAETGIWSTVDNYRYSGLELVGVKEPDEAMWIPWHMRKRFGILINETRNYGMKPELTRLHAMQNYVKPLEPDWVNGAWTDGSLAKLDMNILPISYDAIDSYFLWTKSTFTTPASGSGWATAKPWESFANGTICFFHPGYDTQGHIIPTVEQLMADSAGMIDDDMRILINWLRIDSPEDLKAKVDAVNTSESTYNWLAAQQLRLLREAQSRRLAETMIVDRLGGMK